MDVNGSVESVSMSDRGDVSAVIISSPYSDSGTFRTLQIMSGDGHLLGNYTYPGQADVTGGGRVAISGNACCIVAALGSDGIYYFVRSQYQTQTETGTTSSVGPWSPGLLQMPMILATIVAVALGVAGLSLVMKKRRLRASGRD